MNYKVEKKIVCEETGKEFCVGDTVSIWYRENIPQYQMKHMTILMNGWSGIRTTLRSSITISYTMEP